MQLNEDGELVFLGNFGHKVKMRGILFNYGRLKYWMKGKWWNFKWVNFLFLRLCFLLFVEIVFEIFLVLTWNNFNPLKVVLMFFWMRVKTFYVKGDNVDKCNWLFCQDYTGEIKRKYLNFRCINFCKDGVFLNSFCHLIMERLT